MTRKTVSSILTASSKLYAVVSSSLKPGAKACQAAHALRAYADAFPFIESAWWKQSNRLVLLEVEDLPGLVAKAREAGVTFVPFVDEDLGPQVTAVAFGPDAADMLRGIRLAFR